MYKSVWCLVLPECWAEQKIAHGYRAYHLSDLSTSVAFPFTAVSLMCCIPAAYLSHEKVSIFFLTTKAEITRILFPCYLSPFWRYESVFWENDKKVDKMQAILRNYRQKKKKVETIQWMLIFQSNQFSKCVERNSGMFWVLIFSQIFIATLNKKRTIIFLLRACAIGH